MEENSILIIDDEAQIEHILQLLSEPADIKLKKQ